MSFAEREPRKAVELEVELKDFTFAKIDADTSANLSTGGAFIKMDAPHRPGTLIKFVLKVSEGKDINGVARVVWKRDQEIEPNGPPGVGIKFVKLDPESKAILEEILIGAEEAPPVAAPESPSEPPPKAQSVPPKKTSKPPKSQSVPPKKISKPPKSQSVPPKKISEPPRKHSQPPGPKSVPPEKHSQPPKPKSVPPEKRSQPPKSKSVPPKKHSQPPKPKSVPPESESKPFEDGSANESESTKMRASQEAREEKSETSISSPEKSAPSSDVSVSESTPSVPPPQQQEARTATPAVTDADNSKSSGTILIAILALGIVGAIIIFVLKGSATAPKDDAVTEVASLDDKTEKPPKDEPEKPEPEPEKPDQAAKAVAVTQATDTNAAATDSQEKKESEAAKDSAQEEKDSAEDAESAAQEATKETTATEEAKPEQSEGEAAKLVVNSTPEGATVFVDDVAVPGVTPMTIDTLTMEKEATVRVQLRGFGEKTQKITPKEKETQLNFKLDVARVRFKMSSNPPNARILIDGKYNGKTPFTFMRARYKPEWHFKIEKQRYKPVEGDIKPEDWAIEGRFHVFTFHADLEPKN